MEGEPAGSFFKRLRRAGLQWGLVVSPGFIWDAAIVPNQLVKCNILQTCELLKCNTMSGLDRSVEFAAAICWNALFIGPGNVLPHLRFVTGTTANGPMACGLGVTSSFALRPQDIRRNTVCEVQKSEKSKKISPRSPKNLWKISVLKLAYSIQIDGVGTVQWIGLLLCTWCSWVMSKWSLLGWLSLSLSLSLRDQLICLISSHPTANSNIITMEKYLSKDNVVKCF